MPTSTTSTVRSFAQLIVIAAVAVGCATPGPLVRLYPSVPDVVWVSGRATVTREQGAVQVAVAFEHQDGPTLGLRVEVQNGSAAALDVNPSEFTFTTCSDLGLDTCGLTARVIDPEQVLLALDERQSRERADAINSQRGYTALVILSAVADTATLASGHSDSHTGEGTLAAATAGEVDANARETHLASIAAQQGVWSNEAFRRNTLVPGRGAGGRVYIPIDLKARIVWLHVRTGGHVFSFPFRQTVTQLTPTTSTASAREEM